MNPSRPFQRSIVWLRRDLRLQDNTALVKAALLSHELVFVFVFDTNILKHLKNKDDRRLTFIHESLIEIDDELKHKKNSRLVVYKGDPIDCIPHLAHSINADACFCNEDYEPTAKKRDERVSNALNKSGCTFHSYKDQVIFSGSQVLKKDGSPYQVFTSYKHRWLSLFRPEDCALKKHTYLCLALKNLPPYTSLNSIESIGFKKTALSYDFQKPGRKAALQQLKRFREHLPDYHNTRNHPALHTGTSGLSVHLRFGTLSIRECIRMCNEASGPGPSSWINELIWRDFYQMILDRFPHVTSKAFKKNYSKIKWPGKTSHYKAWCQGQTGYPIVDAAMRQLLATGWMHNRLRMITASFLVKDLLVDPRKGEAHFAEHLLDFDLAANNGGWQWCASTGCDAQPYFRIFNPVTQSKKFDADAMYLKVWIPELKDVEPKRIHEPWLKMVNDNTGYPHPIVEHALQRQKALHLFLSAKSQ